MAFCKSGNCSMTKKSTKGYDQCSICGRVDITSKPTKPKRTRRRRSSSKKKTVDAKTALGGQVQRLNEMEERDPKLALKLKRDYYKNRRAK